MMPNVNKNKRKWRIYTFLVKYVQNQTWNSGNFNTIAHLFIQFGPHPGPGVLFVNIEFPFRQKQSGSC